ncbi:hypothetical protein Droror1_Dr00026083 [Drosera rotundifolia]
MSIFNWSKSSPVHVLPPKQPSLLHPHQNRESGDRSILLECVTCCRTTTIDTPPDHHHPLYPSSPSPPSHSSPKSEETRSLVRRTRTRRTAGGGEWRPSLLAKSEEGTTECGEEKDCG